LELQKIWLSTIHGDGAKYDWSVGMVAPNVAECQHELYSRQPSKSLSLRAVPFPLHACG